MIGSLCTGYGGLDMAAAAVFGQELAWWSDIEPGPIKVMQHHHPDVPNLGDLKTVDWFSVQSIDILTAGYPCQPFSNAGKRLGTEDPRHLWPWISDAIGLLRPRIVVLENVAAHLRRGFDIVSADLANMGYRVAFGIVSAAEAGAPHLRKRLYVVAVAAHPNDAGLEVRDRINSYELQAVERSDRQDWVQYTDAIRRWERVTGCVAPAPTVTGARGGRVLSPGLTEWMMGVPGRITSVPGLTRNQQIALAGNGVVPQQAELAIRELLRRLQ